MASQQLKTSLSAPPATALQLAQLAPLYLDSKDGAAPVSIPFITNNETEEKWIVYENLLLTCLRTGDHKSAQECLERLTKRFGPTNERVMGLRGLCEEATASGTPDLERILRDYEGILHEDPTNMAISKRRVALLKSIHRPQDAAGALVRLLDMSPADPESWSELSDIYLSVGLYQQSIFALEEVLLITPNSWNIHARMGELWYMWTKAKGLDSPDARSQLAQSVKWFCRSIELCDNYVRGFYGLKVTTDALLSLDAGKEGDDLSTIRRLNIVASAKLAAIEKDSAGGKSELAGLKLTATSA